MDRVRHPGDQKHSSTITATINHSFNQTLMRSVHTIKLHKRHLGVNGFRVFFKEAKPYYILKYKPLHFNIYVQLNTDINPRDIHQIHTYFFCILCKICDT